MITQDQLTDIEYCKNLLIEEIEKIKSNSEKIKDIRAEIRVSIIYLKFFSDYLKEKKYRTIEEGWWFMTEIKGINERIFFVNNYLHERLLGNSVPKNNG